MGLARDGPAPGHVLAVHRVRATARSPRIGAPSLALSPDGATLVVRDNVQNGRIWLKRRGDAATRCACPAPSGRATPAFSPDGQWIAFLADGRLRKVRPGEGGAITLADSADATLWRARRGSTTAPSSSSDPDLSELSRVSAAGGRSTVVLRDPTLAGFGFGSPTPLPGARGVLFTVCSSGCVTMSVHLLDLRTGRQRLLLDDVVAAWYLPTGHLLYVRRDGTALVAPFDLERLAITGPAVPVLDGVLGDQRCGVPDRGRPRERWSTAGQPRARTSWSGAGDAGRRRAPIDTALARRLQLVRPVARRAPPGGGCRAARPARSASGSSSSIAGRSPGSPSADRTGGRRGRRTGRSVAFLRDSLNTTSVFERRVDGSAPERLLARLDRQIQEVAWSPDGRWLVLRTDNGGPGAGDIIGVRTSGDTTPVPLVASAFTELHPAVSPDGRWLAYTSIESGTNEVYVRPFPATTGATLAGLERRRVAAALVARRAGAVLPRRRRPAGRRARSGRRRRSRSPSSGRCSTPPAFPIDAFHQSYEVLPGGRGFIFLRPRQAGRTTALVTVVQAEQLVRRREGQDFALMGVTDGGYVLCHPEPFAALRTGSARDLLAPRVELGPPRSLAALGMTLSNASVNRHSDAQ